MLTRRDRLVHLEEAVAEERLLPRERAVRELTVIAREREVPEEVEPLLARQPGTEPGLLTIARSNPGSVPNSSDFTPPASRKPTIQGDMAAPRGETTA
jgi:hypothetical protein